MFDVQIFSIYKVNLMVVVHAIDFDSIPTNFRSFYQFKLQL